jgi:hypothetical protein
MKSIRYALALASAIGLGSTALAQTAGPDGFGYTSTATAFNFTDISGSGVSAPLGGIDDGASAVGIGFTFDLYGTGTSTISVATNGYLTDGGSATDFSNDCPIANAIELNRSILPFWDDLSLVDHGTIYTQTMGSAPNRVFIAQWDDVGGFLDSAASLTYQVKLFEADGSIEFHYSSMISGSAVDASGGTASVGLENDTGSTALQIYCNQTGSISNGDAIRITRPAVTLSGPASGVPGTTFVLNGQGPPNALYVIAFSLTNATTPPLPPLAGNTLDIFPPFTIVGIGLTSGTGSFTSLPVGVPLTAPCGLTGYFQAVTATVLGPGGDAEVSNLVAVDVMASFPGEIPSPGLGDHYTFSGTAGTVVTIEHCRTDNTGMGMSTLDPFLCLIAPSGGTEAFNDDGNGNCEVPGPFSASIISNHALLETGIYTIIASSFQGLGGEVGAYVLKPSCTVTGLALAINDGPNCP